MNSPFLFPAVCLALSLAFPGPARAATVTFLDGTFLVVDWSITTEVLNGGGSVTASQVASGGAPGAYRRINNTMNSAIGTGVSNSVFGFHARSGAVYDPSTSGAILSIGYSEDSARLTSTGGIQACGMALRQGGVIYYGPGFVTPTTVGLWAATSQSALGAANFDALPSGVQNPDFSASGGPIEFGFYRSNSTSVGGSGGTTNGGIDDWTVTLTTEDPVPTRASTWGGIKARYRAR